MGLSYLAFACSIEELESVYSSRDEALYAKLVKSRKSGVRHYLGLDESAPSRALDVPPNLAPLRDIFIGAAPRFHAPSRYAYALIACMYELGTHLGESGGGYGRAMEAMSALDELGEDEALLPDMGIEWPIPGMPSVEDWPMYLSLPAEEVKRRAAAMKDILARVGPTIRERAPERASNFMDDFAGFYERCAKKSRDLVVVCH